MKEDKLKTIKKYKTNFLISIVLIDVCLIVLLYFIMPIIQGFPPLSENLEFQEKVQTLTHIEQYSLILIFGLILHFISFKIVMRNIDKYLKKYVKNENINYDFLLKIRKDCQNIPYKMLIIEWLMFVLMGVILNIIMLVEVNTFIKFTLMIIAVVSLISLCSFIATQKYLYHILGTTYQTNQKYEKNNGFRIKTHIGLLIQAFPLILAMLIIPILFGYANTVEQKGIGIGDYYRAYLDSQEIDKNVTLDNMKKILDKIPLKSNEDYYFIITPNDKEIYTSNQNGYISSFVLDYRDYFFTETDGMLYEKFGIEEQLYAKKIIDNNGQIWYIGFKFPVIDTGLLINDIELISIVLTIALIFLYTWAKNINKNSEAISKKLKDILDADKIDKENVLPIMSNDELGDLSYYYNKIQEKLVSQEDIIVLQSRFSAIGEVAAGMAHDINNPASAIEGTVNLLYDFKVESGEEDYKKLLDNMKIAIDRILSIVNNSREQFRNYDNQEKEIFRLKDLFNNIQISEGANIKRARCVLEMTADEGINIYGIKSKLDQVITNIIRNSVNAYKDNKKQGKIIVKANQDEKYTNITIQDEAGGIPEQVKDTLFKKIITTRGTKGTGLGLYLAANVIKIEFQGDITFETEKDKGTTFFIKILNNKEEK